MFAIFSFLVLFAATGHSQNYVKIEEMRDPDFKRAQPLLNSEWATLSIYKVEDKRKRTWTLQLIENRKNPRGPTWFVPHDNENEAFQSGVYAIHKYGGRLVALDCNEKRRCHGIDPNRNFLPSQPKFTSFIMSFFRDTKYPVLTLHNNHDKHKKTGGHGVISAKVRRPYRGAHAHYHRGDGDDLILFADTEKVYRSDVFSRFARVFNSLRLNHIFEYVSPTSDVRGHMSAYVTQNTRLDYMNIEAQHGHLKRQIYYIDKLMEAFLQKSEVFNTPPFFVQTDSDR